jgi:uncharacterized protein
LAQSKEQILKLSKYNIWLDESEDIKLCYNCISSGFAEFDPFTYNLLHDITQENIDCNSLDDETKEKVKELGSGNILIHDGLDELMDFRIRMQANKHKSKTLGLTVLPTMDCNFGCNYCFEEKSHTRMDDTTAENLLKYIVSRLKTNEYKSIGLAWFGGEPLLEFERIVSLSDKIIGLCKDKDISYSSSMISNCWLLTPEKAKMLSERKVTGIQVTLDGPPSTHDKRRITIAGGPTFDKLIEIIKICSPFIPMIIRVNIDLENSKLMDEFFKSIKPLKGLRGISLYPGFLHSNATKICSSIEGTCLDVPGYARLTHEFNKALIDNGFNLSWYPRSSPSQCCATSPHSCVIQPNGMLCRCWDQVGQTGESYSSINEPDFFNGENYYKWILYDPNTIEECRDCIYFPLCKGGCPARRIPATTDFMDTKPGERCVSLKYNIRDMLKLYYDNFINHEKLMENTSQNKLTNSLELRQGCL